MSQNQPDAVPADYAEIGARLDRVRRALKRAAAARGAAAVVIEAGGMLLVLACLDRFYALPPWARVAGLAAIAVTAAALAVAHILRPLARVITDEQVALYLEERRPESEGALLSAAAFGRGEADRGPVYRQIRDGIVASATRAIGGLRMASVLDLSRLGKYVVAALAVALVCTAGAIHVGGTRLHRLVAPWRAGPEDLLPATGLAAKAPLSLQVSLDAPDNRVLRGGAVTVKARLSERPSSPVVLRFRARGGGAFKELRMAEIDELDAFALRLPDISDDLEIQAASGEAASDPILVTVYDRMAITGYEVTVEPPAYLHQQAQTSAGAAADVSGLIGAKVTVRALAGAALASGEMVFADGQHLALAPDADGKAVAGSFTIERDAQFSVAVAGIDGQRAASSGSFAIHAIVDQPPTVTVTQPGSDVSVHPSAEVLVVARAGDDIGLAKVELVYGRGKDGGDDKRLAFPLQATDRGPGEHDLTVAFAPADLGLEPKLGQTLFYHVEAVDGKGQTAVSDIYMVAFRPYELAQAYGGGSHPPHHGMPSLMRFSAAAWSIHMDRDRVARPDYERRCDELAAKMSNGSGHAITFGGQPKSIAALPTAEERQRATMLQQRIDQGLADLQGHDAKAASEALREALALVQEDPEFVDKLEGGPHVNEGQKGDDTDQVADALGFTTIERPVAVYEAAKAGLSPDYRRTLVQAAAKKLAEDAKELEQEQGKLVQEMKKLAAMSPKAGDKPKDPAAQDQKDAKEAKDQKQGASGANAQRQDDPKKKAGATGAAGPASQPPSGAEADPEERRQDLAQRQGDLAAKAEQLAQALAQKVPHPDGRTSQVLDHLRRTGQEMNASAQDVRDGALQRAAAHGDEARQELVRAAERLSTDVDQDVERAVDAAEAQAATVAEQQRRIGEATDDLAKAAAKRAAAGGEAKPDPATAEKARGLAKLQAENQRAAEELESLVKEAAAAAQVGNRAEAGEELKKAARTIEQEKVGDGMVTSAVSLAQGELGEAKEAQRQVGESLERVQHQLQAANAAVTRTREDKLKRADAELRELVAKAEALAGKQGAKAGDPPAESKAPDGQQPAGDAKAAGDPARNAPRNEQERREAAAELTSAAARVAKRIADDRLADAPIQAQLAGATGGGGIGSDDLAKHPEKLDAFIAALRSASTHLEGKLAATLKAKRSAAALREQCPADYRALVNAYYERLAHE